MKHQRAVHAAILAAAITGFGAAASPPQDTTGSAYSYHYFKERRPLKLDTTRVAVLRAPDGEGAVPAPDLSRYGLDASAAESMAVRGWWFIGTSAPIRTHAAIEHAVNQIAGGETVDFVSPVFLDDHGDPIVITPQILVGLDLKLDRARADEVIVSSGAGAIIDADWANMKRAYRLKCASRDGVEVLAAANRLAGRPEVTFAEPDMMVTGHADLIPNDTCFPQLWPLHNDGTFPVACTLSDFHMDAPEAWEITLGDPSIIVAVLDVGTQLDHPDSNLYSPGFDATGQGGGGGPVNACDRHGTPVAGFVSGVINNNLGIVGIAPGVRVAPVRVLASNLTCNDSVTTIVSWIVSGLAWAESIGARITNSSRGLSSTFSAMDQKYADTRANGILHFASAGNGGTNTIGYPASLPSVNAVAAMDCCGNRADFSSYGPGLDISAPGHQGISTDRTGPAGYNDGVGDGVCLPIATLGCTTDLDCAAGNFCFSPSVDYALFAGTSMASPYAAGVAALVLSVNPALTAAQLEAVLKLSAQDLGTPGYDRDYGWGTVNAWSAVELAPSASGLSAPGEANDLRVTSINKNTGIMNLTYVPGCTASSHDIYYGPLNQVSTYGWSGGVCGIGNTGAYSGFRPGPDSFFFVIVGNTGPVEGTYGTNHAGTPRRRAGDYYCGRTQLTSGCP